MTTFGNTTANALMTQLAAAGLFISLHSADPGITGAAELTNIGYARKAAAWGAASGQQIANNGIIEFGPAGEQWAQATYVGLWSAIAAGTFIAGAALNDPVTVANLASASFPVGDLLFSLDALS